MPVKLLCDSLSLFRQFFFSVAATLKSIDYNVAMTFIFNSNSNNNNSYYYFLNFFITIVIIITTLSQADIRIEWSYVAFWPRTCFSTLILIG